MDSLDLIRTFREVASHGSFSQAAKRLDMSKATVSKYVAELETRFGVRLLNRSTRSVSLTDAGQLLLERSTPVLEMVELTQAELQERASQPGGRLRISAPHGMGNGEFPNLLADFMRYYPDVSISLQLTNRTVDLAEEGIDVDIRSGPVEDANLIVRKLRRMEMVVCASPIYWKKHGKPEHPRDLANHDALTHSLLGAQPVWRFDDGGQAQVVQDGGTQVVRNAAHLAQHIVQLFRRVFEGRLGPVRAAAARRICAIARAGPGAAPVDPPGAAGCFATHPPGR